MLKAFLTRRHICSETVCIYLVKGGKFGCWPGWGHRVRLAICKECTSCFHYEEGIKKNFKKAWRPENKWLAWLQPLLPTYFPLSIHFQNKTKSLDCSSKSIMLCSITIFLFLTSGQRGAWAGEKLNLSFQSLWKSSAWFVGCQFVVFYLTMWWSQLIFMSHLKSTISWKIILCLGKWIKF